MLSIDTGLESFQVTITAVTSEAQLKLVMSRQLTLSNFISGIRIKCNCIYK